MADLTTAFWGMTINNYDETDLALVRQGYPDFIRQLVYTLEEGKEGTPHIQAYIKLMRQQRLSYVKKLFPRGNFKALCSDEYKLNAQRYAQKLDTTSKSPAVITNNPFPDPITELVSVSEAVLKHFADGEICNMKWRDYEHWAMCEEYHRVKEKPSLAKFYVSATYKAVKKQFWRPILYNIENTHTHTHSEEIISREGGITDDDADDRSEEEQHEEDDEGEDDEGDDYGEGEEAETSTESDDCGRSQSDAQSQE